MKLHWLAHANLTAQEATDTAYTVLRERVGTLADRLATSFLAPKDRAGDLDSLLAVAANMHRSARLLVSKQLIDDAVQKELEDTLASLEETMAAIEELQLIREARPRTDSAQPVSETEREAFDEGRSLRADAIRRDEMLTAEELGARIGKGITRQAVHKRLREGKLLGLSGDASNRLLYPAWQLEEPIAKAMPQILETLGELGPWGIYFFLTTPSASLGTSTEIREGKAIVTEREGVTPLDALREGRVEQVLALARGLVSGD